MQLGFVSFSTGHRRCRLPPLAENGGPGTQAPGQGTWLVCGPRPLRLRAGTPPKLTELHTVLCPGLIFKLEASELSHHYRHLEATYSGV